MAIFNFTQHVPTEDLIAAGVVDLTPRDCVRRNALLLLFDELPSEMELAVRAQEVAAMALEVGATEVLVEGPPFLQSYLEAALYACGITPFHAFRKRVSKEEPDGRGGLRLVMVFIHAGFVKARRGF